ncbi:MAG: TonB-dependent receptor [Rikenellaceae bacterium]|nr:TonB-dependent receptor [Rikenellaceae bacterium]
MAAWVCAGLTWAQQPQRASLTIDLDRVGLDSLVSVIEAQSDYRFFYDPGQMRSLRLTVRAVGGSLDAVLRQAFRDTKVSYAVDRSGHVFLAQHYVMRTLLPESLIAAAQGEGVVPQVADSVPVIAENTLNQEVFLQKVEKQVEAPESRIFLFGSPLRDTTGRAELTGRIVDVKTGSPIAGVVVLAEDGKRGTATDVQGFYRLVLPKGYHVIDIKQIGMKDTRRQVRLYANGRIDVAMEEEVQSLQEVVVSADKLTNIRSTVLGVEKLRMKDVKNVPTVFGESDILKLVLSLPGVKSASEASSGFNVRGGSTDQNLMLFNDGTVYNPSHLFGFFSAFNSDIVRDIELYKSSIPVKYGGRLSSVLEVNTREGDMKKFGGSAGIGVLTTRVNIEGPIVKDKTSFILAGRTTYSDWILGILPEKSGYRRSSANFYDFNAQLTHKFSEKSQIYLNGYYSRDRFRFNSDTLYRYSNASTSIKWRCMFTPKFVGVFTGGYDRYEYSVQDKTTPVNAYQLTFTNHQTYAKADFTSYLGSDHVLNYGVNTIFYALFPGSYKPYGSASLVRPDVLGRENALESAVYIGDEWNVSPKLSVNLGLRYSMFNAMGPRSYYRYMDGVPKTENTITDTLSAGKGQVFKTYHGPEIRASVRYAPTNTFSIKAGYNTLRQYIHMLSNTTVMSPTDTWKLSDANIKPQRGDQFSLGLYKNFTRNSLEVSLEGYYKRIKDYLDYRSGAVLVMNHHIETDVVNTQGKAYGVELMLKKTAGKFNGWVSYTYSRILLRQNDPNVSMLINDGNWYPANYDKPHEFKFVGNYKVTHRFSFSLNCDYSTGRPITLPVAKYEYAGGERVYFSDRNAYRIPNYFRLDVSFNVETGHKQTRAVRGSFNVGIYNLTGRKNAYSVYYLTEDGKINGYKLSVFGCPIPYITYNLKF